VAPHRGGMLGKEHDMQNDVVVGRVLMVPMVGPIAATKMQLDVALEAHGVENNRRIPEIRAVSLMKESGSLDPEGVAFGGS
jgi:hypothetical protein